MSGKSKKKGFRPIFPPAQVKFTNPHTQILDDFALGYGATTSVEPWVLYL